VIEAEPNTLLTKDSTTNNGQLVNDNIYDSLTRYDPQGKLVGKLAESWSRVDPTTWRFKLRQGVKFTNGEVFNADAVVAAIEDLNDPQRPGVGLTDFGSMKTATKVDDFTVDITTPSPDPILPEKNVHFCIPAPNWAKTATLEQRSTTAVGSGPYILAEYVKGQQMVFKANPDYALTPKPTIAEIKMVFRVEQQVRGAMVQAGEADLAYNIPPEMKNQVPRGIIDQIQEVPMFRINSEHPVMKDIRVRQAITVGIDVAGMVKALYPDGAAVLANGQLVRQGTVGWNPNLKPYPYDPDLAKRLMQETGAVGTPVEFLARPGQYPRASEVAEFIISSLNQIGFKATTRFLEAAASTEALRSVKPEQQRPDLQMTSVSSPNLDSSRPFDLYYLCGGRNHIGCDQEGDRLYNDAKQLSGAERDKAFQQVWAYFYDKYYYVPLFALNWTHGASARLVWEPQPDGLLVFTSISLKS
jgi:peptide/nickel transport system substrate-binding protein